MTQEAEILWLRDTLKELARVASVAARSAETAGWEPVDEPNNLGPREILLGGKFRITLVNTKHNERNERS